MGAFGHIRCAFSRSTRLVRVSRIELESNCSTAVSLHCAILPLAWHIHRSASQGRAGRLLGATEKTPNESSLIDKFQTPPKEATVRFTVDLPASMHRKLSLLAARTGKKKAEIVRVLLNEVLKDI